MIWYKYFISILLLSLLAKFGQAQQPAIQCISEDDLKRHVSFLASDGLQGRDLGSAGLEAAAEYLRKEAEKAGLKPGGNNYSQNFTLVATRPNLKNSWIKKAGSEEILIDSVICMNQFTKHFKQSGEVVFAGFGFQNENYDDLKNVDTIPEFADNILGEKGACKNYLQEIANQNQPHPLYPENLEIEIQTSSFLKEHRVKNIIGLVEGSDSLLKNECVVYMAHYDHLGTDSEGNIYNGADDNASGCAALLEIAEVFSQPEYKPARSILFLWVTGEEKGFLGSGYYADNLVFPLSKTVACINLDMIGRVYEPRDSVWKNSPKLVKDYDGIYTLVSDFNPKLVQLTDSVSKELGLIPDKSLPEYFFRSSDHYHFHSRNVPILNLSTGYHADYHKVTDEISRIRFDKIKRVAELSFWVGCKMAGN
jgi:hypothetical protein